MEYDRIQIPPYRRPGPHRVLGMSAPGFSGMMRQQAHLPNGQILFEVDGEIYLLDPETLELAFLARGRAAMSFFTPEDFAEGGVPEHAVGFYGAPIMLPGGGGAEEPPP